MTIRFLNNKIAKQLGDASGIKKAFGVMAKKVSMRLEDIRAAPNLAVLKQLPQAACHALKGNRAGEWAVSISGNHRLIFLLGNDPVPMTEDDLVDVIRITEIVITGAEDYH